MNQSLCEKIRGFYNQTNVTDIEKEAQMTLRLFLYEYLSVYIVTFGLISNSILLIVLTRKHLISNPSNIFLIGISFADLFEMIQHVTIIGVGFLTTEYSYSSSLWIILLMPPCYITCAISTWITVCLAGWRVATLYFPFQRALTIRNAVISVICVYLVVTALMGWHYFWYFINSIDCTFNGVITKIYFIEHSQKTIQKIGYYIKSIVMKIIPCFLLLVFTIMILIKLSEAKKRRMKLMRSSSVISKSFNSKVASDKRMASVKRKASERRNGNRSEKKSVLQTSNVLILIFLFSLLCEIPSSITTLVKLWNNRIKIVVPSNIVYLCSVLKLFNCSFNLILYCIMSSVFRKTFMDIFFPYIAFRERASRSDTNISKATVSSISRDIENSHQMSSRIVPVGILINPDF